MNIMQLIVCPLILTRLSHGHIHVGVWDVLSFLFGGGGGSTFCFAPKKPQHRPMLRGYLDLILREFGLKASMLYPNLFNNITSDY